MASNGGLSNGGDTLPQELPQIIEALEAIYNPRSTNELRQSASLFLEQAKQSEGALAHGFSLASDSSKDGILRHFGLSMMIFNLKYVYHGGNEDTLRQYVLHLAQGLNAQDPPFLRNKTAQIWSEVAKRIWGRHWMDMDEQLAKLWEMSFIHQELVLTILETLSEDVFNQEDYAAGLRQDLGSALGRICVTAAVVEEQHRQSDNFSQLRYGQDGWVQRLGDYLKWCLDNIEQQGDQIQPCIIKTLTTLGSICSWITLKALQSNSQCHPCVEHVCYALVVGNTSIRTVGDIQVKIHSRYSKFI
jgi:exportin-5